MNVSYYASTGVDHFILHYNITTIINNIAVCPTHLQILCLIDIVYVETNNLNLYKEKLQVQTVLAVILYNLTLAVHARLILSQLDDVD